MGLDGPVHHLAAHVGRDDLDHRDLGLGHLVAPPHPCGGRHSASAARAWSIMAAALGSALGPDRLLRQRLCRRRCGPAGACTSAPAPARAAPMLRMQWWMRPGPRRPWAISKPRPSPSRIVAGRHAHVLQHDLHVAVRRIVVAEHMASAAAPSRPGCLRGTSTMLCWLWRGPSGSVLPIRMKMAQLLTPAPDDHHLRPLITYSSPSRRMLHWMLVASDEAHGRLGHQEGRADLATQQRLQPLVLLRLGAVALDGLHVAGVRRIAVEDLGRPHHPAHLLAQRRVVQVRQAFGRAVAVRQEQVPQGRRRGPWA